MDDHRIHGMSEGSVATVVLRVARNPLIIRVDVLWRLRATFRKPRLPGPAFFTGKRMKSVAIRSKHEHVATMGSIAKLRDQVW